MQFRLLTVVALLFTSSNCLGEDQPGLSADKPAAGRFVKTDAGYMVPYTVTIPGSDVKFQMEPIPAGEFLMGSPSAESGREANEGPQVKFMVEPFWMARCEVTWAEYKEFMNLYTHFKDFEEEQVRVVNDENFVDSITAPTPLYVPSFTYEYGEDPQQPATTITQYSAKQYSKWMTAVTGDQYRLPSEAEWEYACRAGSTTAFFFGDDSSQLGEYAWFEENTDGEGPHKVGTKKPNPWGLYDMHGNAAEWTLDYLDTYKPADTAKKAANDWVASKLLDPRVVRGGTFEFTAYQCRSAARLGSDSSTDADKGWRNEDPNLPLSPWWFTTDPARGVGFRLIRPLKTLPKAEMAKFWEIDNKETEIDVRDRLAGGRGVRGLVDKELPAAIKAKDD